MRNASMMGGTGPRRPGGRPGRAAAGPLRAGTGAAARTAAAAAVLLLAAAATGGEVRVAVAANFARPLERLAQEFTRSTGHAVVAGAGASTGKLYAQIVNGAPFDVLLAADQARPARLEQAGLTVPGSRFTYATGRLMLFTSALDRNAADGLPLLRDAPFRRLAIANPRLAPYGVAAREVLVNLALYEAVRGRLVLGENIGQTFTLAATGNADFAIVARAQLVSATTGVRGSCWRVPETLHAPIRQDAVLLRRAADNAAAAAFLQWLQGPAARAAIREAGYAVGDLGRGSAADERAGPEAAAAGIADAAGTAGAPALPRDYSPAACARRRTEK